MLRLFIEPTKYEIDINYPARSHSHKYTLTRLCAPHGVTARSNANFIGTSLISQNQKLLFVFGWLYRRVMPASPNCCSTFNAQLIDYFSLALRFLARRKSCGDSPQNPTSGPQTRLMEIESHWQWRWFFFRGDCERQCFPCTYFSLSQVQKPPLNFTLGNFELKKISKLLGKDHRQNLKKNQLSNCIVSKLN